MKVKFQLRFVVGFLLAAGSLAVAGLLVRSNSAQFHKTQSEISNGLMTSLELQQFLAGIDDLELRKEEYVLTGDEEQRLRYRYAATKVEERVGRLKALTMYEPVQQDRVEALRLYTQVRLTELATEVEARHEAGIAAGADAEGTAERHSNAGPTHAKPATVAIETGADRKIREIVTAMQLFETGRVEEAHQKFDGTSNSRDRWLMVVTIMQCGVLALVFTFFYRSTQQREKSAFKLLHEHLRLTATLQTMGEGLYQVDRNGCIVYINPVGEQLLGYRSEDVLGLPAHHLLHRGGDDEKECTSETCPIVLVSAKGLRAHNDDDWLRKKDGSVVTVEYTCAPLVQYGVINGGVVVFRDISERSRMERALRDSEERYRNLVEKSGGLIFIHDMMGKLLAVNEACAKALGHTVEELHGKNLKEIVVPGFGSKLEWYLTAIAEWNSHSGLMRVRTKDGDETVWSYSNRVVCEYGAEAYVLGHAHDITGQVMMEEALKVSEGKLQAALENEKSLSRVDFLTGIPNRRMFYQTLSMEGKRSRRYLRPLTVVYIDVDNFKQINDLRGHAVGDDLLKLVGTVLESTVRSTDTAARLGGDEFAVLLPESDEQAAAVIVAKLQDNLQTAIRPRGWPVTFSFGVVTFPIALDSAEEMIKRADEFMYEAKRSGKSAVVSKVIEAVAKSS